MHTHTQLMSGDTPSLDPEISLCFRYKCDEFHNTFAEKTEHQGSEIHVRPNVSD
jgi:hypothetical protein